MAAERRPLKLAVVSDEFFDLELGRMGGFGWAARQVATVLNGGQPLGYELVFLTGELRARNGTDEVLAHGTRLLLRRDSRLADLRRVRRESIDLMLAIDYNIDYRFYFRALPRVPIVIWVRDPRTPADHAKIATLRIPGAEHEAPQGIEPYDTSSLGGVIRESRRLRRVVFATPAPDLAARVEGTYGIDPDEVYFLPNIVELGRTPAAKAERPTVAFLGRLDPLKRPWLAVELARRLPGVEFLLMGRSHFEGPGSWRPEALPPNLRLLGHLDDAEKERVLGSAWLLLNTSIHEGLAVSFLESLACGTPLVGCQDPGGVVSRFGSYVGRWDGTGLEGLPAFEHGLTTLLGDESLRARLGHEGREWVRRTHNREEFLAAFERVRRRAAGELGWADP